jgi:hypothetical protein
MNANLTTELRTRFHKFSWIGHESILVRVEFVGSKRRKFKIWFAYASTAPAVAPAKSVWLAFSFFGGMGIETTDKTAAPGRIKGEPKVFCPD